MEFLRKKGVTLVEVMVAVIILGIITASGAGYFAYAAQYRMRARAQQAGTIEANTLMEWAYRIAHRTHYEAGEGYYNPDTEMSFSTSPPNPPAFWTYDGRQYPIRIKLTPETDHIALITVAVELPENRSVTLTAARYCEDSP
jgi:prepilin-type N-terminal cleavage/methylation domain-containing protein